MKINITLILLMLLSLAACKKDASNSKYEKSFTAFQSFKKTSNNTYYYVTTFTSWVGYGSETKISVDKGTIIARDFIMRGNPWGSPNDTTRNALLEEWHEDKATLGTHDEGAELLTLDQVYDKAKNEWLKVDRNKNTVYFETQHNGVISSCGYVPKNCMDDCFIGIRIKEIVAR